MTDALPMFRNWASDPEVTKFLTWPTYQSVDSAYYILDKAVISGIELSFMAIGEYQLHADTIDTSNGGICLHKTTAIIVF